MGGASSTLGTGGLATSFSQRAQLGKRLPDEILNIFFKQADFKDLLSLSSLDACPTYMFTTAEALETLFQKLQVAPKLGKKGEILFAPLAQIAPGSVKETRESDQERAKKVQERNSICMEVAYYYVRIFQIYAALALSVLEADPVRRPQARGAAVAKATRGPQQAVFLGGAFQSSGKYAKQTDFALKTPWAPLAKYFSFEFIDDDKKFLKFDGLGQEGAFKINWDQTKATDGYASAFFYKPKEPETTLVEKDVKIETNLLEKKSTFYIENDPIQTFIYNDKTQQWMLEGYNEAIAPQVFRGNILKYFLAILEKEKAAGIRQSAPAQAPARGPVASSAPSSSGKSEFVGFTEMKQLFEKRFKGEVDFPKAYCIARAMTLLMPIFDVEKLDKRQPFYSQICRRQLDFESAEYMPRPRFGAGRAPKQNVYFSSLISLYYDDYSFSGGKVVFTQTETGRSDLRNTSILFAKLYNVQKDQNRFLEDAVQFPAFPICQKTESLLQISDEKFRKALFTTIIQPMLQLQEEHTAAVNSLLKEMFAIKDGQLRFSAAIRQGGKTAINEFGRKAHALLRNYYLKSEAFYIRGMLMFEKPEYQAFFKPVV